MSPGGASPWRLGRSDWLLLAAAVVVAHGFFARILHYPSSFDAANYLELANDIERNGLFRPFPGSEIRTYGYPLFLAMLVRTASWSGAPVGLWLFEAQLALYLAAALYLRAGMARIAPSATRIVFAALTLNPIVLAYAPESLSESLSLTLIVVVAGAWVRLLASTTPLPREIIVGTLAAAFAMVVRPANVFVLIAWLVAMLAVGIARRWTGRAAALVALAAFVCIAVAFAPQIAINLRFYGQATPLPAASLGHNQQIWGIAYLKYGTALPPVPLPSVFYANPFAQGRPVDEAHPLRWYRDYPGAGAATLALHAFNLLDQDLLFTYSRDLDPWYRIPLGILTHGFVALALLGIWRWSRRAPRDSTARIAVFALVVFVALHLGVHVLTAVEMRFGLPLLLIAFPLGAWCAVSMARDGWRDKRMLLVAAWVAVWVAGSLSLSTWVRDQSPSISAWEVAR